MPSFGSERKIDIEQLILSRKRYRLAKIALVISIILGAIGYTSIPDYLIPQETPQEMQQKTFFDYIDSTLFVIPLFTSNNITRELVSVTLENEYKDRTIDAVNFTIWFPTYCDVDVFKFKSDFMNTITPTVYKKQNEVIVSMGDFSIDCNSSAELDIEVTWSYFDNNATYIVPSYRFSATESGKTYIITPRLITIDY